MFLRFLPAALLAMLLALPLHAAEPVAFPLKDGDVWVMAGDSITAQHLHSNYFEAFCYARYPKLKFAFRNSGVGGHTIPSTLARFDYDLAGWKPTVVSVELGMNDAGGTPTEKFISNMGTMVARIKEAGARPVILSASPVNDGLGAGKFAARNARLDEYATALKPFAEKEKIPYADQFHALVEVWAKNKQDAKGINLTGDAVHPGAPGQLMMAASLLKSLGAEGFVSEATLDAAGTVTAAKGCAITNAKADGGTLSFDRLDETLPFPIPENARVILPIAPDVLDLSKYTLKVTGLKEAEYTLTINGAACGTLSAKALADGVNLTNLPANPKAKTPNPIAAQGLAVLAAVAAKEGLVGKWRSASRTAAGKDAPPKKDAPKPDPAAAKASLVDLTKQVEEADAKIRDAAKPQKLHFVLSPVK
ncbi:MAG: SGNH/GDSL hydrolase family protein [Planctomycetes bacterium]|nr:SGNH/GDSL hydrolase family protein [Planctomycetota bacterium]